MLQLRLLRVGLIVGILSNQLLEVMGLSYAENMIYDMCLGSAGNSKS